MTLRSLPENTTREPAELGCKPSPASITPAFTSSSLKAIISLSSCSLGISPASLCTVALTRTMTRMSCFLLVWVALYPYVERAGQKSTRALKLFDQRRHATVVDQLDV